MSTKLFRNILLGLSLAAMLTMAVVAYGRHTAKGEAEEEECCLQANRNNTEMPWEALASQWFRAVSL